MTSLIQSRIKKEDKEKFAAILNRLGLDISSGMHIFVKAVISHKGIPFPLELYQDDEEAEDAWLTEIVKERIKNPSNVVYSSAEVQKMLEALPDEP